MSNSLFGRLTDVSGDAGYEDHPPRMGFFTDTSVCIGCKACEVACKEWNDVPDDGYVLSGMSYDNTQELGASTWRHVAFVEKPTHPTTTDLGLPGMGPPGFEGYESGLPHGEDQATESGDGGIRWLMSSDVCKHCTHAACLDVCPTGALFRTEFGTVVVQPDVCNGCGYCVPACPYGVIDQRKEDGRVFKCTLCYDRLEDGQSPACAQACPTESIQFGDLGELRHGPGTGGALHEQGVTDARLYGADQDDGVGGDGVLFLLLDEPEVYGLPPDPGGDHPRPRFDLAPRRCRRCDPRRSGCRLVPGRSPMREQTMVPEPEFESYYGRQILKTPTWKTPDVPLYLFLGGMAGSSSLLAEGAALSGRTGARAGGPDRRRRGARRRHGRPDPRPRPARAVPEHAARLQAHVPALGRVLHPGAVLGAVRGAPRCPTSRDCCPRLGRLAGAAVRRPSAHRSPPTPRRSWPTRLSRRGTRRTASSRSSSRARAPRLPGGLAMVFTPLDQAGPARRMAVAGAAVEIAAAESLLKRLGMVAEPYEQGRPGRLMKTARTMTAVAAGATMLAGRRSRLVSVLAGTTCVAASVLTRFGVFEAGIASAKDPKYVVVPQRERLRAAAEVRAD